MNDDIDLFVSVFDECGITSASDDLIRSLSYGELIEDFGPISIPETGFEGKIKSIEKILSKYIRTDRESIFWSALTDKEIPATYINLLCLILVSKDSFFQYGVQIYSTLLCSEQCCKIWSSILFAPILKVLITAQQIIENGAKLNAQTKLQLTLTASILKNLSFCFSEGFANLIENEILTALCELVAKLICGIRVEMDSYNTTISTEAINAAKKIAKCRLDNLLPFLVPVILLNFASNSNSLTARLERLRNTILQFVQSILQPSDDRIVLLCRHLMTRSPEKLFLKKNAAFIVYSLTKYSLNAKEIIDFAIKLGKSKKNHLRSFSVYLLQYYIINIGDISHIPQDTSSNLVLEMSDVIKSLLSDVAPTVRSAALDCLASIIENLNENQYGAIIKHVIDASGSLETILRNRIVEEKLIVRRSALNCLTQIVISNARSITPIMIQLISNRIRDRALSIRTMAIKSLNSAIERFPDNELLNKTWLDSVLPSILDQEDSVKAEALGSIEKMIFNPLINGEACHFTSLMTTTHFDFMKNVFKFCKSKAISLSNISNAFSKILFNYYDEKNPGSDDDESIYSIWKLVSILSSIESSHFKVNKYFDLWNQYKSLPPEYFTILANLQFKDDEICEDLTGFLDELIQSDSRKYNLIHSLIQLIRIQDNVESIFQTLLSNWTKTVNDVVQSASSSKADLEGLGTMIFAFGEGISASKWTFLNDFDYTGLKLLFSSALPNGEPVPVQICALAVLSLGKLCLVQKDLSRSFVSAFAHLLSSKESDPVIKCNCLIVLCDLCVAYSALVEPYIKMMTTCFADPSPLVRHQTLILLTRLIIEDYLKMSSIMFFRYIYAMVDKDQTVSSFAINCLLNVITNKFPDLIKSHFMEALFYFSNEAKTTSIGESDEERKLFAIRNKKLRHVALSLLISRMDNLSAFKLIDLICQNILSKFINGEYNLTNHSTILDDSIYSLIELEDKMDQPFELDTTADDSNTEKLLEESKRFVAKLRNSIIQSVMPSLNKMHGLLRDKHSPLQGQLKILYQRICTKNPDFIKELEISEPILALELKYEMEEAEETIEKTEEEEDDDEEQVGEKTNLDAESIQTPTRALFKSSLLSKIATTPRSMLCTPYRKTEKPPQENEHEILDKSDSENSDDEKDNHDALETPKKKVTFRFSTPPHDPKLFD